MEKYFRTLFLLWAFCSSVNCGVTQSQVSYNANANRREASSSVGGQGQQVVYSTLPEASPGLGPATNYYNYQLVDGSQPPVPHQDAQSTFANFQPQLQPQPQPQLVPHNFPFQEQQGPFPFQQGQGDFNFNNFDGSNNEIQEAEESGILSTLMNSILEGTGIGYIWNRMSEMWNNLTGDGGVFQGMSRVAMGAMAIPFMLPMAAVPLGLGAMALMAFPVLQLTLPGIRRSFRDGASMTHSVLASEECMERLSCNLARVSKIFPQDGIFSRLETSENKWLNKVGRSVRTARSGESCQIFQCSPVSKLQSLVRTYILGGDKKKDE